MGRLEKIVVVTVLFLVAVILGYSLSADGGDGPELADGRGANAAARESRANAGPGGVMSTSLAARPGEEVGAEPTTPPAPLDDVTPSDTVVEQPPVTPTPQPVPEPVPGPVPAPVPAPVDAQPRYVVTLAGLAPTASEEFMLYTWQAGDTFRSVSETYYGSALHAKRLRDANEGRDEATLAAGDRILVSVKPTLAADRISRPSARTEPASTGLAGGSYTVASGDVLGTISQKVYGSASKWRKIYDANRDVIGADPNQLRVGMVLRIPQ